MADETLTEPINPQPNPPLQAKTSIGSLTYLSFYHMLVLSFFVSVELVPGHEAFKAFPVHMMLYSLAGFFEAFFGLVFLNAIPDQEDATAVEFLALLVANWILAFHMTFAIHLIMCLCTFLWWLLCIIVVYRLIGSDVSSQFRSKCCKF
ncbi:hypothetical protein A2U01_0036570, partial [Trifolium medium]|nr:hypothetical protein [Trifolium medium]